MAVNADRHVTLLVNLHRAGIEFKDEQLAPIGGNHHLRGYRHLVWLFDVKDESLESALKDEAWIDGPHWYAIYRAKLLKKTGRAWRAA